MKDGMRTPQDCGAKDDGAGMPVRETAGAVTPDHDSRPTTNFGPRTTPRDPEPLFDPRSLEKPRCPSCGQTARNLCGHDADIEHELISRTRRRPKHCLASAQLGPTDPFPEGF